jgi:hypothetical protein
MPVQAILLAVAVAMAAVGCAETTDEVWTVSERMTLAPGKDFAHCADEAVHAVPGLSSVEDRSMRQYFDGYLVLGGPAVESLHGMIGDLSLRGSTIQVEFTSHRRRMPDDVTREAAGRLVVALRARVASSCS